MAYSQTLKTFITDWGNALQAGMDVWTKAVDAANANTLDTKVVLQDSILALQQGMTVWWSLLDRGEPLPPVAYFEETAANIIGADRDVSLADAVPVGAVLHAGPLMQLGGNKKLTVSDPTVVAKTLREVINIVIAASSGGAPVAGDAYFGIVYNATTTTIVATVIARIT
jgi:hypothetical protein